MLWIAVAAWLAGVAVAFVNGHRLVPAIVLLLGLGLIGAVFWGLHVNNALGEERD